LRANTASSQIRLKTLAQNLQIAMAKYGYSNTLQKLAYKVEVLQSVTVKVMKNF